LAITSLPERLSSKKGTPVTRLAAFWLSGGTIIESTSTTTFGARNLLLDTWFADHSAQNLQGHLADKPGLMIAALG
jgi:hypothetical protein